MLRQKRALNMKLRNKRTGEIKDWDFGNWYQTILNPENKEKYECNLNDFIDRTVKFREDWEDYEEPKEYWFIENDGYISSIGVDEDFAESLRASKEIGNYFETEEEAEKAVEKLKAWKRLKDKGFRFIEGWLDNNNDYFIIKAKRGYVGLIDQPDVNLLFGGKDGGD